MASLKSNIMMMFIIINIVHADFWEDEYKCIKQLKSAYKYTHDSAVACLRYAVKYYIKGQRIEVPLNTLPDENQNYPSGSQNDSRGNQNDSDFITRWLHNELQSQTSFNLDHDDGPPVIEDDPDDMIAESSNRDEETVEDNSERLPYWWENENWSGHDSQQIIEDNSERLPYWWENENWSARDSQQIIEGSSQSFSDNTNLTTGYNMDIVNNNTNLTTGNNMDIVNTQQDPLNYAELYHKELEKMISGSNVPNRKEFCSTVFEAYNDDCYEALKPFGDQSMDSVEIAFIYYTLPNCEILKSYYHHYVYVYSYMEKIISSCRALRSVRPSQFCEIQIKKKYNLTERPIF